MIKLLSDDPYIKRTQFVGTTAGYAHVLQDLGGAGRMRRYRVRLGCCGIETTLTHETLLGLCRRALTPEYTGRCRKCLHEYQRAQSKKASLTLPWGPDEGPDEEEAPPALEVPPALDIDRRREVARAERIARQRAENARRVFAAHQRAMQGAV
jgi:hypothetical protein